MRTVIRVIVAASLVAAAQVPAPHAGAITTQHAGKFAYVTRKIDIGPQDDNTQTAQCPAGYNETGGGVAFSGKADQSVRIGEAKFDSSQHITLTGGGRNDSPTTARTLVVTVICRKTPSPAFSYAMSSIANMSGLQTPSHICNVGDVLVGGSGSAEPIDSSVLISTFPHNGSPTVQWVVRGFSLGNETVSAWGVCELDGIVKVKHVSREVVLDPGKTRTLRVDCPAGRHVAAGGWDTLTAFAIAASSRPVDGPDAGSAPDNGWQVSVTNGQSEATVLAVHALCEN